MLELGMTCTLLICVFFLSKEAALAAKEAAASKYEKQAIVIDPGHGGADPGMIGMGKLEEKRINLSISLKLKELLEERGYDIILTREGDYGLYEENSENKKMQDMKTRTEIIDHAAPVLTVSIHQNSYSDLSVKGPQVFYYKDSKEGKVLAEDIQKSLNTGLAVARPRQVKGNSSYYLLRNSKGTLVIVECGFLTNPQEAALLQTEEYQKKVAGCIARGIENYLESGKNGEIS